MDEQNLIVTRHGGCREFLERSGISAPVVGYVTPRGAKAYLRNKHVYGSIPIWMAAYALSYTYVDIPGLPPSRRGTELSCREMLEYGARLRRFVVREESPETGEKSSPVEE